MPSSAVRAFIGRVYIFERMSHTSSEIAPVSAEAGRSVRWSALAKMARERCGIAIPIKPTGPQNAVTVPASSVVESRISRRVRVTLSPIVRA